MIDISKLNSYFMSNGQLNEEQVRQAEDYAMTRGISVDEALIF